MNRLNDAIAAAVRALPEAHVERLAQALEGLAGPGSTAQVVLEAAATGGGARERADALSSAWEFHPALPGTASRRSSLSGLERDRIVGTNAAVEERGSGLGPLGGREQGT